MSAFGGKADYVEFRSGRSWLEAASVVGIRDYQAITNVSPISAYRVRVSAHLIRESCLG
jgi:hypothetical protein